MEKSHLFGDRGSRRWESRKKWFRRLKSDWNDHWGGWSPVYEWKDGQACLISPGDATQLCECFDLTTWAALRFKDTPKTCSGVCCGNPRRWMNGKKQSSDGELTLAERVADMADREFWSKRKRRAGFYKDRILCRCGFLLAIREVPNGQSRWTGRGELRKICDGCRRKEKA